MSPQPLEPGMPVVPGKQLIATVTRQRDRHLGARQSTDQEDGNLRDVGKWFIPDVCELWDDVGSVGVTDPQRRVVGPQMCRDSGGLCRLVERAIGESDGERPDRMVTVPLHQ